MNKVQNSSKMEEILSLNLWIDSHAHIDKLQLETTEVLRSAKEAGVFRILSIGTEREDWGEVLSLCEKHSPEVYGALGMHPHTAKDFDEECEAFLREHLNRRRIVALGEIGLDYYYENSDRKIQREVFEKQLSLAGEFHMPVEIHSREAEPDTAFFLKQFQGKVRGFLHCFTGSYDLARQALDCGFNISFSGIVTFKNAGDLRETCKKIPLDRLHIETDSPFLSPEPFRGQENQPAHTAVVARQVAELHSVDLHTLSDQLKKNTWDLFPKIKKEEDCLNQKNPH